MQNLNNHDVQLLCAIYHNFSQSKGDSTIKSLSCKHTPAENVLDPVEILQAQLYTCHLQIMQKRIYVHTYNMMITSANS